MASNLEQVMARAISPSQVRPDGRLTSPRSFGVYLLPAEHGSTRRYRLGNHPVRQRELEEEFGRVDLLHLFRSRQDAATVAAALNGPQARLCDQAFAGPPTWHK
jgi:hypothetical protein